MKLRIPNNLSKIFSGVLNVTRIEYKYPCLNIYSGEWWKTLPTEFKKYSARIRVSKDGSFILPDRLKKSVGIGNRIIILPHETNIEIWDEAIFWKFRKNFIKRSSFIRRWKNDLSRSELTKLQNFVELECRYFKEANPHLSSTKKKKVYDVILGISVIKIYDARRYPSNHVGMPAEYKVYHQRGHKRK